jgi:hypothetical protein
VLASLSTCDGARRAQPLQPTAVAARHWSRVGRAAEALDNLAQAETLYRQCWPFATHRGLRPECAETQLALGCLLAERLGRCAERCPLLLEAAQHFAEMGMPAAEEAGSLAERLGCDQ